MNTRKSPCLWSCFFWLTALLIAVAPLCAVAAENTRPNLLLIYVDDMGYGDPGCYGGTMVETPNIDRLAETGAKFTSAYVTAPVCGPSRVGLLTGAYQQRFGVYWNPDTKKMKLPEGHELLPGPLKAAGYATAVFGKWNLPVKANVAFDVAKDIMDWEGDYFPDETGHYVGVDTPSEHASSKVQGIWGPAREGDEYLTDRITRHALDFIEEKKTQPWFTYLAYNAPHSPFQAKKEDRERFAHLPEPLNYYAAMVRSLDENIGKVLGALADLELTKNTLIVFASDNGPAPALNVGWHDDWSRDTIHGSTGPFNGHKGQFFEGGNRVPFIMSWPGHIEPGAVYEQAVSTLDVYPTLCAAAGVKVPEETRLDGHDLMPFLNGKKTGIPHEKLFWVGAGNYGAYRRGDWKLVFYPKKPQLYDLAADPGESTNLRAQNPELVEQMSQEWQTWLDAMPPNPGLETNCTPTNPGSRPQ